MLSSRIPRAATYLRFGFTNLCGDRNSRCDFRFFSPGYRIVLYAGHIRRNRMLGHSNVRNVGRGDRSVCGHRFFALPLHPCKEKPCFSKKSCCARGPGLPLKSDTIRPGRSEALPLSTERSGRWLLRTPIPKRGMATKKDAIQKTPSVPREARDTAVLMRKKYALRHPLPSEKCVTSHFPAILPTD